MPKAVLQKVRFNINIRQADVLILLKAEPAAQQRGEWSDWDKSCPSCSSSQCWDGSKCEDAPSDKGKTVTEDCAVFGISYTCNSGTGWEKSKTYIHLASSAISCWDGSSCVAKPSTCDQETTSQNCKVYKTTCTCTPSAGGWVTSTKLTGCPSGLRPEDDRCIHPSGAKIIYISGEIHGSGPCTANCPFGISSMKTCGTMHYAINSSGVAGCTICDYPYAGYLLRMNNVSSI